MFPKTLDKVQLLGINENKLTGGDLPSDPSHQEELGQRYSVQLKISIATEEFIGKLDFKQIN